VKALPGLEHLPYAEAWFHRADDTDWRAASDGARAIGKSGLEAWTTTRTPDVAPFLAKRGFQEVRRYVISELDVTAAPDPGLPAHTLVSLAERPGLADELYLLARVAYADQPGRAETRIGESWFEWGLRAHPPEAYLVALDGDRVLGYGYLEHDEEGWRHGFTAVARDARGTGVAGSIKRGQIAWARANGVETLRTANEARLAWMLALNRRFGYAPLYEEIVLRGPLS
jgi:GNAT superfamily N-acetyltransferase